MYNSVFRLIIDLLLFSVTFFRKKVTKKPPEIDYGRFRECFD